MYIDPKNWSDGEKYFSGCFIKVKEYGDTLVRVDKVTPEALWGVDAHGENICIEIDGKETGKVGYDLDYVIPKKSYFQWGSRAVLLQRIPARMWKKGLNKQNTSLVHMTEVGSFSQLSLSFEALQAYVNKKMFGTLEDLQTCESVALSPRIAMCKAGLLYVDRTAIGKYYSSRKTITVKKMFVPEVTKVLQGVKIVTL